MSKVYIALQENEESRYIVEAIEEDDGGLCLCFPEPVFRFRFLVIAACGKEHQKGDSEQKKEQTRVL